MNKLTLVIIFLSFTKQLNLNSIENICGIMYPRSGDKDWGIGALIFPKEVEFELYQNKKHIGKLKASRAKYEIITPTGKSLNFKGEDLEFLGHVSHHILKVKEITEDGNAIIFWKTFKGGIKVNLGQLKAKKVEFYNYKELLLAKAKTLKKLGFKKWANIGVNLQKSCLNLRRGPSKKFSKITCIPGNDWKTGDLTHTHLKIIDFEGLWAKVKVTKYVFNKKLNETEEGCMFDKVESVIGWVKAIDNSEFPNIWYSVTVY